MMSIYMLPDLIKTRKIVQELIKKNRMSLYS